jgi:hypothetical protein
LIDYNLHGLPQVKNYGVGCISHRFQAGRIRGQPFGDARQVPLDGRHTLGKDMGYGIQWVFSSRKMSACTRRKMGSMSHQICVAASWKAMNFPRASS